MINIYIHKYVKTTDDWCPNYDNDTVKVFLFNHKMGCNDKYNWNFVKICATGNDDFCLEMDFQGTEEENDLKFKEWKENIFDKIPEPCTIEYFEKLGFVSI